MAQGKLHQEIFNQGQCGTRSLEMTNGGEQTLEGPGKQNGNKGPNHKRHWRVEPRTAIAPGKWRNAQEDPILDFQREDHETSSRYFQQITKNDGLDL
jgi:hypothetical protein